MIIMYAYICRSHLYRKHNDQQCIIVEDHPQNDLLDDLVCDGVKDNEIDGTKDLDEFTPLSEVERKRNSALFILKAREERMMTQTAVMK